MPTPQENQNAVGLLCAECGSEVEYDGAATVCPKCGLIDRNPTPPVENIPNICRNPQCLHPLDPEHDDIGCHIDGCLCTETRRAVEAPEDVLPNAETKHDPKDGKFTGGSGGESGPATEPVSLGKLPSAYDSVAAKKYREEERLKRKGQASESDAAAWRARNQKRKDDYMEKDGDGTENSNVDQRAAFDAHAKECQGCMNAYNSGQAESLCEKGLAMMNADASRPKLGAAQVFDSVEAAMEHVRQLKAAGKDCKYASVGGKTTVTEILANADVAAKGGDEAGTPGKTTTIGESKPFDNAGAGGANPPTTHAALAAATQEIARERANSLQLSDALSMHDAMAAGDAFWGRP